MYSATVTVVGRPAVPFTQAISSIFLTVAVMFSATIIPTFVAELIRLWFENTGHERYPGNVQVWLSVGDGYVGARARALFPPFIRTYTPHTLHVHHSPRFLAFRCPT